MKRFLFILLILTVIFTGCSKVDNKDSTVTDYKKITSQEAKSIIDSEDVIILDVRTEDEYDAGHIKDSTLLPVTEITEKAKELLPDKDAKILVYCRSGNRSAAASKELIKLGYTNVYDFGGINTWTYGLVK